MTGLFEDQPSLQDLYLNDKNLTTIDETQFYGLHELGELYLDNNQITAMTGSFKN